MGQSTYFHCVATKTKIPGFSWQHKSCPRHLLYSTSARIGGSGLDSVAHQSLIASYQAGFLRRAIGYANRQHDIPARMVRSLRWHPVRLLSFLERPYYYGLKKHYSDWIAARELASGRYDLFHSWAGDCVRALRVAKDRGIPSLLEIPTWHRNKGKAKPDKTRAELRAEEAPWNERMFNGLLINRQQNLEEYELADIILVLSEKARETFLAAGISNYKLYKLERGVDAQRFHPAPAHPSVFRVVFVGALIERKGVHHLLKAWKELALPDSELVLVGTVHDEMKPHLARYQSGNVRILGFVNRVEDVYRECCAQIFPSTCEGSAKTTYEAAACGLAQITTRESGDVVEHGVNGLIVPPDDAEALKQAILELYGDRERVVQMGCTARERILAMHTWDHFRARLMEAYALAYSRVG